MRTFEKNGRRGRRLHDHEEEEEEEDDTNDNAGWPFDDSSACVFCVLEFCERHALV